ncbi:MAG: hypothetical protein GY845_07190, partial [Planctomycetes bacterium]|nr:hypothetical protein [Planctomycetota bacterium]
NDLSGLSEIAKTDSSQDIRKKTIERLNDPSALAEIVKTDSRQSVRKKAIEHLYVPSYEFCNNCGHRVNTSMPRCPSCGTVNEALSDRYEHLDIIHRYRSKPSWRKKYMSRSFIFSILPRSRTTIILSMLALIVYGYLQYRMWYELGSVWVFFVPIVWLYALVLYVLGLIVRKVDGTPNPDYGGRLATPSDLMISFALNAAFFAPFIAIVLNILNIIYIFEGN